MTEEIIVDGVDVAGCEFCKPNPLYKIEYACHCRGYIQDDGLHVHLSCEHNPNCYYKQLKRLEQENKEIYENGQIEITKLCNEKTNYRSALEDINILVKNYCNACDEFKVKTYKNKNDCLYCNYGFIKRKIDEVLK